MGVGVGHGMSSLCWALEGDDTWLMVLSCMLSGRAS